MDIAKNTFVQAVRKFNRFYTNILGLLDQHILESDFSLVEARILFDVKHMEDCTAKRLIESLHIDPGYLSRMIKRFVKNDLIHKVKSSEDGRIYYLYLTKKGEKTLSELEKLSNQQVFELLEGIPKEEQEGVFNSMSTIERAFSEKTDKITFRSELRPGDVGYLIYLHGWIYAKDCEYNYKFEGYVCKTFYDFFENYDSQKDQFWFAESSGKIIGAIAIVGHTPQRAQLRWFILDPNYRGLGLGKALLMKAMRYAENKGYKQIFLETTQDQQTAIRMYRQAGFEKTAEKVNEAWGRSLIEENYEVNL